MGRKNPSKNKINKRCNITHYSKHVSIHFKLEIKYSTSNTLNFCFTRKSDRQGVRGANLSLKAEPDSHRNCMILFFLFFTCNWQGEADWTWCRLSDYCSRIKAGRGTVTHSDWYLEETGRRNCLEVTVFTSLCLMYICEDIYLQAKYFICSNQHHSSCFSISLIGFC